MRIQAHRNKCLPSILSGLLIVLLSNSKTYAQSECYRILISGLHGKSEIVNVPKAIVLSPQTESVLAAYDRELKIVRNRMKFGDEFAQRAAREPGVLEAQNPRFKARLSMGFSPIEDSTGIKGMIPPLTWREYFNATYRQAEGELVGGSLVPFDLPALTLTDGRRLMFYTPGIDPEPTSEWRPSTEPHMLDSEWTNARAQRRIPITLGYLLHDFGHDEESRSLPEIRDAWHRFHLEKLHSRGNVKRPLFFDYYNYDSFTGAVRRHIQRYIYVSEMFSAPDLTQEPAIRARFSDLFGRTDADHYLNLQKMLNRELSDKDLAERIQRALNSRDLILPLGGGSRDGYNRWSYSYRKSSVRFLNLYDAVMNILRGIEGNRPRESIAVDALSVSFGQDLLGLLDRLVILDEIEQSNLGVSKQKFRELRIEYLSRFEVGLKIGIELRISPSLIIDSLYETYVPKEHAVRKWVRAYAPQASRLSIMFTLEPGD